VPPGIGTLAVTSATGQQALLYRIVEQHYSAFTAYLAVQGRVMPGYVQLEFEDYLKCRRLEHGFLRVLCESCHADI